MKISRINGDASDPALADMAAELSCGLIMPISAIDGCTDDHWAEVKTIIIEAVESISEFQFTTRLVSDADEIGVIQKRIIQNIYNSDIVVCDVSGKNPNVMFELGLRLAFDKPTVIIKDDRTDYSFDTGVIEHVDYPRDLRFGRIVEFKRTLAEKVANTYRVSIADPSHSSFLRSFGQFHVASLAQSEESAERVILEMLSDIQRELTLWRRNDRRSMLSRTLVRDLIYRSIYDVCNDKKISIYELELNEEAKAAIVKKALASSAITAVSIEEIESVLSTIKTLPEL